MNSEKLELSEKVIIEILFDFIKQHFNDFGHHYKKGEKSKWWHNHNYGKQIGKRGDSWAPFVQACFIKEGEKLNYKIGECRTYPNLKDFMKGIKHPYGSSANKYPCRCYDISWVNDAGELFLALEHEESANKGNGGTADKQLEAIYEELEKLGYYKGKFKVLVSRPHLQKGSDGNSYPGLLEHFKKKITNKLTIVKPHTEENWIIILIAPEIDLKKVDERTKIKFHSYKWETDKLMEIEGNYSFEVKMDNGGNVIKV